jgi:hypothetical protein
VTLTVALVAWLGLSTLWELMDGWAKMATRAHEATPFEEWREAGAGYAKVLGAESARVFIMTVARVLGAPSTPCCATGRATSRRNPGRARGPGGEELCVGGSRAPGVGGPSARTPDGKS